MAIAQKSPDRKQSINNLQLDTTYLKVLKTFEHSNNKTTEKSGCRKVVTFQQKFYLCVLFCKNVVFNTFETIYQCVMKVLNDTTTDFNKVF